MAGAVDSTSKMATYYLNNGREMPAIGLGTFRIKDLESIVQVIDHALAAGYRMFDTAAVYRNETYLHEAFQRLLPKHDLDRDDIFITTKLSPADHGEVDVIKTAYFKSLANLGLEFVDLYLIHFPGTQKLQAKDQRNTEMRLTTWQSLVKVYDQGYVNSIGVSNFTTYHLTQLLEKCPGVIPAVNQVEWHPFYYQTELLNLCKEHNIVLQAYCSLGGQSVDNDDLLLHPTVTKIAKKLGVKNAQVLLKWAVQQDISIIPKSEDPVHIKENINLDFSISESDMNTLNKLSPDSVKYAWDPSAVV